MDYTLLHLSKRRAAHLSGFGPSTVLSGWWELDWKVYAGSSKPRAHDSLMKNYGITKPNEKIRESRNPRL